MPLGALVYPQVKPLPLSYNLALSFSVPAVFEFSHYKRLKIKSFLFIVLLVYIS